MARKVKDITGQKFGRLTVLKFAYIKNGNTYWNCICECGNEKIVSAKNIKHGKTKSCGCYFSEIKSKQMTLIGQKNVKHGDCRGGDRSRIYLTWRNMIHRCEDPRAKGYERYGGRGIKVCEEWHNYPTFKEWAMNNGYADNLTIDRIDNHGNYEPSNCRWATAKEQQNNTSYNHNITMNGETKTITEWAEIYGIKRTTINARIRRGMNEVIAVTKPVGEGYKWRMAH